MQTTSTIPVTISDEAAARVAELGMQREFEEMLEYLKTNVPGVRSIAVTLDFAPWMSPEPAVLFDAERRQLEGEDDPAYWKWNEWLIRTFPQEVGQHFATLPF
jgi:hypothetical protein